MNTTQPWQLVEEPSSAAKARALAAAQKPDEATFWDRTDLLYLGDLDWTGTPGEAYEYISDLQKRENDGFQYTYGLVGLSDPNTVGQTMICSVRDTVSDPLGFEMEIGESWQLGPLEMWIQTLPADVQIQAKSRYQSLIAWIRNSLQD